nr:uncharacterized protein LOC105499516 isoform X1 [Macaca nemestrina]
MKNHMREKFQPKYLKRKHHHLLKYQLCIQRRWLFQKKRCSLLLTQRRRCQSQSPRYKRKLLLKRKFTLLFPKGLNHHLKSLSYLRNQFQKKRSLFPFLKKWSPQHQKFLRFPRNPCQRRKSQFLCLRRNLLLPRKSQRCQRNLSLKKRFLFLLQRKRKLPQLKYLQRRNGVIQKRRKVCPFQFIEKKKERRRKKRRLQNMK